MIKWHPMRHEQDQEASPESEIYSFLEITDHFYNPPPEAPPLEPTQRMSMVLGIVNKSKNILERAGYGQEVTKARNEASNYLRGLKARKIALKAIEVNDGLPDEVRENLRARSQEAFSTPLKEPGIPEYTQRLPGLYGGVLLAYGAANFEIELLLQSKSASAVYGQLARTEERGQY